MWCVCWVDVWVLVGIGDVMVVCGGFGCCVGVCVLCGVCVLL